jgi:hypothetical protein
MFKSWQSLPDANTFTVFLVLAALSPGCTTLHPGAYASPVPEPWRRERKAVLVMARPVPESLTPVLEGDVGRGRGATKGAAKGAGAGALAGVYLSLATGPLAPAAAVIFVPIFSVVGAVGGAAVGAATTVSARDGVVTREALVRSQRDLTAELGRRVSERLPGLGKVAVRATDSNPTLRLEVSVDKWGLDGSGGAGSMAGFFLTVSYSAPQAQDGVAAPPREFTLWGARRRLSEWGEQDGAVFRKALEDALATAAEMVTDAVFLIHDFHEYQVLTPNYCGLVPLEPGGVYVPSHPLMARVPMVASVQPTLSWEAFPRKLDIDSDSKNLLTRVSQVRYDLRIWKSNPQGDAGDLIYTRQGLSLEPMLAPKRPKDKTEAPEGEPVASPPMPVERVVAHALAAPLDPNTMYLWSVRARFLLDGEERVTRWSLHQDAYVGGMPTGYKVLASMFLPPQRKGCLIDGIPALHHHRFRTP